MLTVLTFRPLFVHFVFRLGLSLCLTVTLLMLIVQKVPSVLTSVCHVLFCLCHCVMSVTCEVICTSGDSGLCTSLSCACI